MRLQKKTRFLDRLVAAYLAFFSLIMIAVLVIISYFVILNQKNEAEYNYQVLAAQQMKQLETILDNMDNVAYQAMTNPRLIQRFSELRDEQNPENHFDHNIMDNIDTGSILTNINGQLSPYRRISAYNEYGDFISTGAATEKQVVAERLRDREIEKMLGEFRSEQSQYFIRPLQKDRWSNYFKSQYMSFYRPIMNLYSRDVVGIVEVQCENDVFTKQMLLEDDTRAIVCVFDDSGRLVSNLDTAGYGKVSESISDNYGWKVEIMESKSVRISERIALCIMMALIWAVMTVIFYLVIRMITKRITQPLTDLTTAVHNVNIASLEKVKHITTGIDEIIALEQAFNKMLENLKLATNQEKQSFFMAMQAQMNPHFLYNVLSVLNAMALEGKSDVVAKICEDLSGMLRYSASYADQAVQLEDELRFTESYLKLMKARLDYMLVYDVIVEEALLNTPVPKLILQPLCENCFSHGFSNMEPPYHVELKISSYSNGWCVKVTDNGDGFSDKKRQELLDLVNGEISGDISRSQIGGLGVVSVVSRLKFFTQKEVICNIDRIRPKGTSVTVYISNNPEKG